MRVVLPLVVPHRLPGPAVPAVVVVRENRFLARCRLADGREVEAHVPDRGRLLALLVPGANVLLYAAPGSERRTAWSLLVCEEPATGVLVAIDPAGANARARALLDRGLVPGVAADVAIRPEFKVGASRIDFLLTAPDGTRTALEVKSVGVVEAGIARFPDAPTERGVRHLEELAAFARSGEGRAVVLFVAQRRDARAVGPDARIDPAFAAAMERVRQHVRFAAVAFDVRAEGSVFLGEVPVVA